MYCKKCGEKIDDDSKFCRYCGAEQNHKVSKTITQSAVENHHEMPSDTGYSILKDVSYYDQNYTKENNAAIVGGTLIAANILFVLVFAPYPAYLDSQKYATYALIINAVWRLFATNWCINIANRQNRSKLTWGIIGFIVPNLALLILGTSRKLTLNQIILFKRRDIEYKFYKRSNLFSFGYGRYEEFYFTDEKGKSHTIYRKKSNSKFFVTYPSPVIFNTLNDYFEYIRH